MSAARLGPSLSHARRPTRSGVHRLSSRPSPTYLALYPPSITHRATATQCRRSSTAVHLSSLPDPHIPPSSDSNPDPNSEVSDNEWELRTGRAIDVLTTTLPTFFSTGLVTRSFLPKNSTSSTSTPASDPNPTGADGTKDQLPTDVEAEKDKGEPIYSPKIYFAYTPPYALPSPFPRTLHVEGLPLYIASSMFIRHTLNALYADLSVDIRKLVVLPPSGASATAVTPQTLLRPCEGAKRPAYARERRLLVGLTVSGHARVSGTAARWDVNSTYTFSPHTGLIHKHSLDSIEPAPHEAVFDILRAAPPALRPRDAQPGVGVGGGGARMPYAGWWRGRAARGAGVIGVVLVF